MEKPTLEQHCYNLGMKLKFLAVTVNDTADAHEDYPLKGLSFILDEISEEVGGLYEWEA